MKQRGGLGLATILGLVVAACGGSPASPTGGEGGVAGSGSGGNATGGGGIGGETAGAGGAVPPPPPPSLEFVDLPRAVDLTPDGSVALLEGFGANEVEDWFYDTVTKELTLETSAGDPARDFATGISATLRVSANHGVPVQAGLWSEAGDWLDLGTPYPAGCDQDVASAWDVSADGSVAVGLLWNGCSPVAFRWTDTGGAGTLVVLDVLGSSPIGTSNRATAVSDDGAVAVGFAQNGALDRTPALWHADGTGVLLDPNETDWPGEALSVSADGNVVAGTRGYDGFYWTEAGGMQSLGTLASQPPDSPSYPNAIAADGALIFGACGDPWWTIPIAFVWTPAAGMRPLADVIAEAGLVVPEGWLLTNVLAASTDGSVVLGTAWDDVGNAQSFVLRMPVSAYGAID